MITYMLSHSQCPKGLGVSSNLLIFGSAEFHTGSFVAGNW